MAGCAATAMAQIMKYYEFPTSYNWANMLNNEGATDTSNLILDIGLAVDMEWGCISSGAYPGVIASAFENDFGYSTYTVTSLYNSDTVKMQLESNRPVLLYGYNESGGGHIWVNDGYQRTIYCETGAAYLLLHMNWGWKGYYDGWFNYNDWSVVGTNYNIDKRMIYNIIP